MLHTLKQLEKNFFGDLILEIINNICLIVFFLVIVFAFINSNFTYAQTNELGLFFGGSLFHGDLGFQNSENAFLSSKPSFGINIKRNINYYFGLNLSLTRGIIQAKDSSSKDLFNQNRDLDFRSSITDLSLLFEFNFQPYSSRDSEYNNSFLFIAELADFILTLKDSQKMDFGIISDLLILRTRLRLLP